MTDQTNKNRKWVIAFGLGFLVFYLFLDFFWNELWIWSVLPLTLFAIGFIVFSIKSLKTKEKHILAVIATVILVITGAEVAKSEIFKSPIVLNAALKDDLSVINLRLRENKTFEVDVVTMFSNEIFSGKYSLKGDKLIFLDKHYSNDFIPDTLTIGNDKIYFQYDKKGKPLSDFASYFSITESKLKNGL